MSEKLLFVDDDANVLHGYQRGLSRQFSLNTASGAREALTLIDTEGPFGVVLAKMRISGMGGVELLAQVKQRSPDTVLIVLADHSEQQIAIDAVNDGSIFRFLTTPCPPQTLSKTLLAGLEQHRLITAEKDLLENTLRGSVQVLAEVLALASPEAFGRTTRIKRYMQELSQAMGLSELWRLETLALLSQIGCVTLPDALLLKLSAGRPLNEDESDQFNEHPTVGSGLLAKIPRLEEVAECIKYQEKHFDGTGIPRDSTAGEAIPLGARLLKVVVDFDRWQASGLSAERALQRMQQRSSWYDPRVLDAFAECRGGTPEMVTCEMSVTQLSDGMFLAADVETRDGIMLVCLGQETTHSVRQHLEKFWRNGALSGTVTVSTAVSPQDAA